MIKCPKCGNEYIIFEKYDVSKPKSDIKIIRYEFYCGQCGLFESKEDNDPDFSSFYRKWHYPSD